MVDDDKGNRGKQSRNVGDGVVCKFRGFRGGLSGKGTFEQDLKEVRK